MECISDVWVDQFNQLGLPVALLFLMFYSLYSAIKWLAPKLDLWVNTYLAIQEQKSKTLQEFSEKCLANQAQTLTSLTKLSDQMESLQKGN